MWSINNPSQAGDGGIDSPLENKWLFWELGPVIAYLGGLG